MADPHADEHHPGIRAMPATEAAAASVVFVTALAEMAARTGMALPPLDEHFRSSAEQRIALLATTDAAGSFVAERDGEVVGFSQACQREGLWMLTYLFVHPDAQDAGTGRRLLDAALSYGDPSCGAIMATPDPRAMHRYLRAGFDLHPTVAATGTVRRAALLATPDVRDGGEGDLDLVTRIDREVRGAARSADIESLLRGGAHLLVRPDRGYALVRDGRVSVLAATDVDSARQLLHAGLAGLEPGTETAVTRLPAGQQWAMRVALDVGLRLGPFGPVMTRGWSLPAVPYLFDPSLG